MQPDEINTLMDLDLQSTQWLFLFDGSKVSAPSTCAKLKGTESPFPADECPKPGEGKNRKWNKGVIGNGRKANTMPQEAYLYYLN